MTDTPHGAARDPRGCRYIHGHPGDSGWHYCQEPTLPGSAYCAEHHAQCHMPPEAAAAHLRRLMAMVDRLDAA